MKTIVTALLFACLAFPLAAQNIDTRRKIEVYGSAEQEVTPDIIYISISLREYFKDNNNKNKVSIRELEQQLVTAVKKAGIKDEDFTINNISSYNAIDLDKKKDPGFLASKQYKIKVKDLEAINSILESVDAKGIQSTNISGYDHSRMTEIKNELRIKAVENAKQKALVIATALGDKLGKVLEVNDGNTDAGSPQPVYKTAMIRGTAANFEAAGDSSIDVQQIKINYQIRFVFELL